MSKKKTKSKNNAEGNVRKIVAEDEVFLHQLQKFAEASELLETAMRELGKNGVANSSRKYPFKKKFESVNKKIQKWFVRTWEL